MRYRVWAAASAPFLDFALFARNTDARAAFTSVPLGTHYATWLSGKCGKPQTAIDADHRHSWRPIGDGFLDVRARRTPTATAKAAV